MSESFVAQLINTGLKKTLASDDVHPVELTPDEQRRMCKDWLGKRINISHGKKTVGKVDGSWFNEDDGTTHVILTTEDSETGKKVAEDVKSGKLPSVSAGWGAFWDEEKQKPVHKFADHVAICKTPVYRGSIIYGVASNDEVKVAKANEMVRTAGGLGLIPVQDMNAAILIESRSGKWEKKRIPHIHTISIHPGQCFKPRMADPAPQDSQLFASVPAQPRDDRGRWTAPGGSFPAETCKNLTHRIHIGTTRPAESPSEEPVPKNARSDLMSTGEMFETGKVSEGSSINLTGDKYKELMTKLEEAKAREDRLTELEAENHRLQKESVVFEHAKKDIVEKEQKTIEDVEKYLSGLDERIQDSPEGKPYKSAFQHLRNQILPAKDHPEYLVSPAFQEKDKNFLLTMQAASLDVEHRLREERGEKEKMESKLEEAVKTIEMLKQESLQRGAKIEFLQRGARSSSYQTGVHSAATSTVMANASTDGMFSGFQGGMGRPSGAPASASASAPAPSTPVLPKKRGLFAAPAPKEPVSETPAPAQPVPETPSAFEPQVQRKRFKTAAEAMRVKFGMDPRFMEANEMRRTGQLKMISATASLDDDGVWDETMQLDALKNSSKDNALPKDTSRWESALAENVRFPSLPGFGSM
jgi:hypothetical protein